MFLSPEKFAEREPSLRHYYATHRVPCLPPGQSGEGPFVFRILPPVTAEAAPSVKEGAVH